MNGKVCTCWRLKPDGSHGKSCDFAPAVAESNHTTNEGGAVTKGTLRHTSGLEIPNVERTSTKSSDRSFGARLVPSTTTPNYFYEDEGWTFVPDEPELPEGEGYAVIGGGYYPLVYVDGQWRQTNMSPRTLAKEVVLARLRQPDVRLYDDDGKDITPNLKEEA